MIASCDTHFVESFMCYLWMCWLKGGKLHNFSQFYTKNQARAGRLLFVEKVLGLGSRVFEMHKKGLYKQFSLGVNMFEFPVSDACFPSLEHDCFVRLVRLKNARFCFTRLLGYLSTYDRHLPSRLSSFPHLILCTLLSTIWSVSRHHAELSLGIGI